jgi:hypothetical protein
MATTRLSQILLLALAVTPTAAAVLCCIYILLVGETASFNWQSRIWPVVILQVMAIIVFGIHADSNRNLAPGDEKDWILEFI